MKKILPVLSMAVAAAVSHASFTVATFSDPSNNSSSPLFTFDTVANTLTGSWTGANLTLVHPGFIGGGQTSPVSMNMNPVSLTPIGGGVYTMGAGVVDFLDSSSNLIFKATFSGGLFVDPFSASSADVVGNNVSFSGPNVPNNLTNEQFSFSLANRVTNGSQITYTASFTSSADVVPEPASMTAVAMGLGLLARRRNKR